MRLQTSVKGIRAIKKLHCDQGAALVELAILAPLFLLFIAGIVDFGFRLNAMKVVSNAAEHGSRVAAAHSKSLNSVTPCGERIVAACNTAREVPTNPLAPITNVAYQATCNYLNLSKLNPAEWQLDTRVVQLTEPPGSGNRFQLVEVSLLRGGGCTFCYSNVVDRFISGGTARFVVEGRCI